MKSGGGALIRAQCPPNDGAYALVFTSVPGIDKQLCILVTFFHAAFQPKTALFLAEFAASGAAFIVLPYVEASRQGHPFLLAFPTLFGIMYQNVGVGVMYPLYWLAFILSGQARLRPGPAAKIDQAHAEATMFALFIGAAVPSLLMYFLDDAIVTAAWQAFPVWMWLSQQAHLLVRPSSRHPQSGYKTIQVLFIATFILSAATHLAVVWPLLEEPDAIKYYFLPRIAVPDPQTTTLEYAALIFLQWDATFAFGPSLIGSLWVAETVSQFLILALWNVVGSIAFGPGAAISGFLLWREARLNSGQLAFTLKQD